MRIVFIFLFAFTVSSCLGFSLHGVVSTQKGERLGYANIHVKGTTNGTSANVEGQYIFELPAGTYEVIFQHLGYRQRSETVKLEKNTELNVTLEDLQYEIKDVVINGNEDPAIAVIRKAIEKRKYFLQAVESYSCDAYVKGVNRLTDVPFWAEKRIKSAGIVVGKNGVVYLSESQSKLYYKRPDKFHEVVYSSKVSGKTNGFTFNSAQNFYFNFYERNITIQFLAQRPLISPLSESGFFYYNYHMLGAYKEGDRLINKIQVTPKRKNDPCFSGVLSIVEDNWNIHSLELVLTKNNGIQYLDTLRVTQYFVPVKNDIWLPTQQRYDANGGVLGIKGDGYYLGIFKNYIVNDVLGSTGVVVKADSTKSPKKFVQQKKKAEKKAEKKLFSPEIMVVEKEANKHEEAYWDSVRPLPLTELEVGDYQAKDSIEKMRESPVYLDSVDKINNKPKFFSILTGYVYRKQNKKFDVTFPSLLGIVNYNTVEGVNFQLRFGINRRWKDGRRVTFEPVLRYGAANRHFNGMATLTFRNSQINDEYFTLSGGKYISQFNEAQPQTEFGNTWQTLVFKNNFMKLYEQYFVRFSYAREVYNGIDLSVSALYAQRFALENMSHYNFFKTVKKDFSANGMDLPGLTEETDNINRHNSLRLDLKLHFTFGQQYITRPDVKFRVGSKYPELLLMYKRAIPIKGVSDLDYDFLEAQLAGNIPLKIVGTLFYRLGGGGFPTNKRVEFSDYKHFAGNFLNQGGTDLLGFYLTRYYRYSTNLYFAEAHIEHHFSGFLFNKIPGIRKLKLDEILGFHFLYTPVRKQYLQVNAGLGNILKVLRVDFVAGFGAATKEVYYGARMALNISVVR